MSYLMRRCFKVCFSMVLLGASTFAFAEAVVTHIDLQNDAVLDHRDDVPRTYNCSLWDRDPIGCRRQPQCTYDRYYDSCVESGNDGDRCSYYSQDYRQCVSAGCSFDGRTGQCYGSVTPYPPQPPRPQYCSQHNYDQYQCERTGCYFDPRSGICSEGRQYPRPGRGYTCVASDSGFEEHAGGHQGFGLSQLDAQRDALLSCERLHGSCRVTSCQQSY